MNVPNRITLLRILLVPVFMFLLLYGQGKYCLISLVVFLVAGLTDFIDGYIARSTNQITNFGKFMDPLADKLLILAALLSFLKLSIAGVVPVMIMLSREFLVTSLRVVAISEGRVIAAGLSGKVKTFVQIIGVAVIIFGISGLTALYASSLSTVVIWIMTAVSVWSGADYLIKNRFVFNNKASKD